MSKLKRIGLSVLAFCSIVFVCALAWMYYPVINDTSGPDLAVEYANQIAQGEAKFEGDFFEYNGNKLHYVSAGEGDVVLFLHGFPSFWYSLIRPMTALKEDYRVVAIDGMGKGRSDVPTELSAYTMENMTRHIIALIDHLGVEKVHLVGHDWGNAMAFGIAQRYPERVKTLTGMSAPPQSVLLELITTNEKQKELFSYVNYFRMANPLLLRISNVEKRIWKGSYEPLFDQGLISQEEGTLFRKAASNPKRVDAHINWYRANLPKFDEITDEDFWPSRKARVQAPTLFIWGKDDFLITPDTIAEIASVTDNLTLLELDGVGHRPQFEKPDEVNAAIKLLISDHE
ncbi:MAG: alpha/beta fold hydrolase [Aliiglaciecola sp.]